MESLDVGHLLRLEYERLQASIDKFDEQRFKVKGWTITVAGALFAFGVNQREPWLPIAGAVVVAFFLYMELIYMDIEHEAIKRSNLVEGWLTRVSKGQSVDDYTFGIGPVFSGVYHWKKTPKLLKRRPHISVFYSALMILLLLGGLLLFAIN